MQVDMQKTIYEQMEDALETWDNGISRQLEDVLRKIYVERVKAGYAYENRETIFKK